ncbi:hypothetical protein KM918_27775 [Priestia megaterium]|uniref:hypothetical protein n=1 Tax=Priestia megaterium TaxID=1404 RepID=UPI001C2429A6|nr:hypothetical protein [Priestia megaterium]MBU8691084.1 hypothetical protein [Priestia megaterium]
MKKILMGMASIGLLTLSACGGAEEAKESNKQKEEAKVKTEETAPSESTKKESTQQSQTFKVDWKDNSKVTVDSANIDIATNLKDGTQLLYEVRNSSNDNDRLDGNFEVQGGVAKTTLDLSNFQSGEITIRIRFYPFQQSEELRKVYGDAGENLTGQKVVMKSVGNIVGEEYKVNK